MKRLLVGLVGLTGLALCSALSAAPAEAVKVERQWARATVAAQKVSVVYLRLTAAASTRLVGLRSPQAGSVGVHRMEMDGDVMRMRTVAALDLVAGQPVELKPGGMHVMLMDLKRQLKVGETIDLTLELEGRGGKRSTQQVGVPVRASDVLH